MGMIRSDTRADDDTPLQKNTGVTQRDSHRESGNHFHTAAHEGCDATSEVPHSARQQNVEFAHGDSHTESGVNLQLAACEHNTSPDQEPTIFAEQHHMNAAMLLLRQRKEDIIDVMVKMEEEMEESE
eukprot:7485738-Karenia_brevis.AAC.1